MKALSLITELDEENDLLQCDAGGIQQILVALIVNSIEATSPGGKITIKTEYMKEKDRIRITVTDDGKGIPRKPFPTSLNPSSPQKPKVRDWVYPWFTEWWSSTPGPLMWHLKLTKVLLLPSPFPADRINPLGRSKSSIKGESQHIDVMNTHQ